MAQNKEENIAHVEKQDEENNYNELYPKPSAQLASLLKKYLISGAQLNLGYYVNLENKRLFPLLLKESVTLFQKHKCQGCKGSHQFVIAGKLTIYNECKNNWTHINSLFFVNFNSISSQEDMQHTWRISQPNSLISIFSSIAQACWEETQ